MSRQTIFVFEIRSEISLIAGLYLNYFGVGFVLKGKVLILGRGLGCVKYSITHSALVGKWHFPASTCGCWSESPVTI